MEDKRILAIYSRKSKYTGKGESVENQIEMCRKYLKTKYEDADDRIVVYEDEGYTGANTKRPSFQKMLNDIKKNKISTVICYRLDRISRNVLDFCALKDELSNYDVSFISIREDFDTSTPMGTAMLMICSVFAQLERDTIAERIRDNMIELAKTGRWLGGTTPTGYKSEIIENITVDGKKKRLYRLTAIDDEQKVIKLMFDKYLELKSQTKLETYLIQNNIKTKNDRDFTRFSILTILTNPVYAIADEDTYNYLVDSNIDIYADKSEFNGKNGLMAYNKTDQKTNRPQRKRHMTDWIVSVGKHEGIISGTEWVETQKLLSNNSHMRYRKPRANQALLSGILRCNNCGSFMRPKLNKAVDHEGNRKFVYMCELKEKSRCHNCNNKNLNGIEADRHVIEAIRNLMNPQQEIYQSVKKLAQGRLNSADKVANKISTLKQTINKNEADIENLINRLKYVDVDIIPDITNEVKKLKESNVLLQKEIFSLNKQDDMLTDVEYAKIVLDVFDKYFDTFEKLELITQRDLIKLLAGSITFDGEELTIDFRHSKEKDTFIPLGKNSK